MSLPVKEESLDLEGSHTELDEVHGNQLTFRVQEDELKSAIERAEHAEDLLKQSIERAEHAENKLKSIDEELEKKNEKKGPERTKVLGASETKQIQSCGEEEENIEEDMEYDGVNFSALRREMTVKKMWHERTWLEVLKHFAITLIMSVLPTFFDVGTDINAVWEYLGEGNKFWGWTTFVLIFLPGLFFSIWFRKASNIGWCKGRVGCKCYLFHPLSPIGYLLFPFILIPVKIVGLFNPGPEWKRFTVKMTSFEGDFESSLQTLLTLYILFMRAKNGQLPEWWQVAQLTASMVMVTKTAISDYLLPRQPMSLKAELKSTIILIPLFLSNCVFKILSCGTVAAQFRANTFLIFPLAIGLLHLPNILACCCKIGFLTLGSPKHMIKLLVIQKEGRTTKQSMTNFLYNNTFWFIFYTLLLSIQLILLPQKSSDPEEEGLPQEIFQALC